MAEREAVIADKDTVIVDGRGLSVQIVAGTQVPAAYLDAYNEQAGKSGRKTKAERAPETDKAERSPETTK